MSLLNLPLGKQNRAAREMGVSLQDWRAHIAAQELEQAKDDSELEDFEETAPVEADEASADDG